jgi:hypothetical protein
LHILRSKIIEYLSNYYPEEDDRMANICAFSKAVKEARVYQHEISDIEDITKIEHVILKLESLTNVSELRLDELDLDANPRRWITSNIRDYPRRLHSKEIGYLLSDFTDAMKTRMREESKYAISLVAQDKLILSHSYYGEETITPEWKIIPRMLDTDNVLRYVCFTNHKGIIKVRFWERESTSSFIEWLGLPRKQAFLFGGAYRIRTDIDNITTEFQLAEDEIENWMKSHPEFREGRVKLDNPIEFIQVNEVRVGHKRYNIVGEFIQDYDAENYGITEYQKKYEKLMKDMSPLFITYYDEKTRLAKLQGDEEITEISKKLPSVDIIFMNEYIKIREGYIADIVNRCLNNEKLRICHAGVAFHSPPLVVGNLEFYNKINVDVLVQQIVDYFNMTNLQDRTLFLCMKFVILSILAKINVSLPIFHFIERLAKEIIKSAYIKGVWTKLEGPIVEYKPRGIFDGNNDKVVEEILKDINVKLESSSCKVYIIGVEDDGTINPITRTRLKSDRIESIRKKLESKLSPTRIYALPIVQESGGIVIIIAHRS